MKIAIIKRKRFSCHIHFILRSIAFHASPERWKDFCTKEINSFISVLFSFSFLFRTYFRRMTVYVRPKHLLNFRLTQFLMRDVIMSARCSANRKLNMLKIVFSFIFFSSIILMIFLALIEINSFGTTKKKRKQFFFCLTLSLSNYINFHKIDEEFKKKKKY